jgi:hypothetical protein
MFNYFFLQERDRITCGFLSLKVRRVLGLLSGLRLI